MPKPAPSLPDLQCACANLRRAARLVTQLYSLEMGPGIDPAQFALLSALRHISQSNPSGTSQTQLGLLLGLDKTTLSRNLAVLQRNGWIAPAPSTPAPSAQQPVKDRREKTSRLTPAGEQILNETYPGWQRAQAKLHAAMSPDQWKSMSEIVGHVAQSVAQIAATATKTRT